MITTEELGRWLTQELREHESHRPPAPGLAEDVLTLARRDKRRRAGLVGAGAALIAATVVTGAVLLANHPGRSTGDGPPPGNSSPDGSQAPSDPAYTPQVLLAGAWAATLPLGAPPEVAYATQTDLYRPDGQVVDLGGTDSVVIGDTVAGTVLLVVSYKLDQRGLDFRSWYVVVSDDGQVTRLDNGRITGSRVQEAVVSPDGRWFSDGRIFDMTTGEVTGALPEDADILIAWTPAGILYGADDASYLWSPEGPAPVELDGWAAVFPNRTDVGVDQRDGCPVVVRLSASGDQEELSRHCDAAALTVSPSGSWFLTGELLAINTATGEQRALAGRPLRNLGYAFDAHWLNEDHVILSVPGGGYVNGSEIAPSESAILVRCDLVSATCERASGPVGGVGTNQLLSLP